MERLAEVKSNPKYPFRRFLDDDEEFVMSQLYWVELFKSVISRSPHAWRAWFSVPERDGNPIFSVVCESLRRGVIVMQYVRVPGTESAAAPPLAAWLDTLASDPPIEHLSLGCEISDATEAWSRRLFHDYAVSLLSRSAMEAAIRQVEDEVARTGGPA